MRFITWLELAASAVSHHWHEEDPAVVVRPVELDERGACFGVTLNDLWLCGKDGALTVFDSMAAATRFLHLLNVDRFTLGESRDCAEVAVDRDAFECYRLAAGCLAMSETPPVRRDVGRGSASRPYGGR